MRATFVLLALCVPAIAIAKPKPAVDHSREVVDRMRDAVLGGDVHAAAALLAVPLTYEGIFGPSLDACAKLGDHGVVKKKADLEAFAACMLAVAHEDGAPIFGEDPDMPDSAVPGIHVLVPRGTRTITRVTFSIAYADTAGEADGVDTGAPPPPPPPPPPPAPVIVAPSALNANRISGTTNIVPDDATRAAMVKDKRARLLASVKLCVKETGDITGVNVVKSSGYPAYDKRISDAVAAWKYRPYMVNGKPTAACTAVIFIYSQS
jgi:TonB family protein